MKRSRRDNTKSNSAHMQFRDNGLLPALFGAHDRHLARIEQTLGVVVGSRGNEIAIDGPAEQVDAAQRVLSSLYDRLTHGDSIGAGEVDAALRMAGVSLPGETKSKARAAAPPVSEDGVAVIETRKRSIRTRSLAQARYVEAMRAHELVFGLGPAGTGKTYLAVAVAVSMYLSGQIDRIVLSRPAVEAGERLGFLPGDIRDKIDPYLRPLYDALYDMMPADAVEKRIEARDIEIAPLAFMRGRTLANAFIILDEAQNTTPVQMKMFLTRMGENARMVVTGDLSQIDLPAGANSGLKDALMTLQGMPGAAFTEFTDADVVRNPMVTRIVRAYQARERAVAPSGDGPKHPGRR
ncbi:MAG: PhoH family protein [Alphaproteobacteria bacterium]|nr:PhoH family protein [Alphaproteobacteria bacterium]